MATYILEQKNKKITQICRNCNVIRILQLFITSEYKCSGKQIADQKIKNKWCKQTADMYLPSVAPPPDPSESSSDVTSPAETEVQFDQSPVAHFG